MEVCLMIEGQDGPDWEAWLELAAACERSGITAMFRSDHYAPIVGDETTDCHDAWTTVAGLAAATNKLRLGVLVSPVTFRHPAVLAKTAVGCDHISGGRIEVGLGAGWYEADHRRFGFAFPPIGIRMEMLEEQVQVLKGLWSGDRFNFDGRHYRLQGCLSRPLPVQVPHPPLIIGGACGPRSARIAARWANEYNTVFVGPEECRRRKQVLENACMEVGREPATIRFSLMTGCVVGESRKELERRLERVADLRGERAVSQFLASVEDSWVIGTLEQVTDRLGRLAEAGVDRVMLQHLDFEDVEMVELLGERVAPAVRDS